MRMLIAATSLPTRHMNDSEQKPNSQDITTRHVPQMMRLLEHGIACPQAQLDTVHTLGKTLLGKRLHRDFHNHETSCADERQETRVEFLNAGHRFNCSHETCHGRVDDDVVKTLWNSDTVSIETHCEFFTPSDSGSVQECAEISQKRARFQPSFTSTLHVAQ